MQGQVAQFYALVDGAKGAATIGVALIALVGAISGTITSYIVAGRTVYINSITAERSKWIDKLRTNIATFCDGLGALAFRIHNAKLKSPGGEPVELADYRDELEKLNHSASLIQLQLNPWGEIDKNILALIQGFTIHETKMLELLARADMLIIAHSQWLLKAEWEKVKFEARSPLYRFFHYRSAELRLAEYRKWANGNGSIAQLLADFANKDVGAAVGLVAAGGGR